MARTFDPTKQDSGKKPGDESPFLNVAGDYLLVIKAIDRDKTSGGTELINAKTYVIHGPMKGKRFRERFFLSDQSLWRLGKLAKAMGQTEAFDLDSDRSIAAALCNRPFKARVGVKKESGNDYAEIRTFLERLDVEDEVAIAEWLEAFQATKEATGSGGFDDSDSHAGGEPFGDGDPGPDDHDWG